MKHKKFPASRRLLLTYLLGIFFLTGLYAQNIPARPNKIDAAQRRQGEWIIWYDESWNELSSPAQAVFYRLLTYRDDIPDGTVLDFYRNGVKQWEGNLLKDRPEIFEGKQTWYYETGEKKTEEVYHNNEPVGAPLFFLRDGQPANASWEADFYNKALDAYDGKDAAGAGRYFREALRHVEAIYARESEPYADILEWLRLVYYDLQKDAEMLACEKELVAIYRKIRKPGDPAFLKSLYDLARHHKRQMHWPEAEHTFQEFFDHEKKYFTGYHELHGLSLSGMAEIMMETMRYQRAVDLLENAVAYYHKHPPEEKMELELLNAHMARARTLTGQWSEGKKFMKDELSKIRQAKGEGSSSYILALSALGNFSRMNGQLREAEKYYSESLILLEKYPMNDLALLMSVCIPLAEVYQQLGLPHRSEKYLMQAERAFEKADRNDPGYYPSYTGFLKRALIYYHTLGNEKEVSETLKNLKQTAATSLGKTSTEYAFALMSEAEFAIKKNQFAVSLPVLSQAESIMRQLLPSQFSASEIRLFAKVLQLSGTAHYLKYSYTGGTADELQKAEQYLIECAAVYQRLPEQGFIPEIIDLHLMRAAIHELQGNRDEADRLYDICLQTVRKHFGESHVYYPTILFAIAKKSEVRNDIETSYRYYREALVKQNQYIRTVFPYLSVSEKESFYKENSYWITNFQGFASLHYKKVPALADELCDLQLSNKGVVLQSLNRISSFIAENKDKVLMNDYEQWRKRKNALVRLYQKAVDAGDPRAEEWRNLEAEVDMLEKKISARSNEFASFINQPPPTWKMVQEKLKDGDAAIEITFIPREINSDTVYFAMVVKKNETHPIIVELPAAARLEGRSLKFYRNAILMQLQDMQSYSLFWEPIAAALKDVRRIYLSADGVYHQINVATLYNPASKKYVSDEVDVYLVPSTAVLAQNAISVRKINTVSVFAHPDYGKKENENTNTTKNRSVDLENISDLPGTEKERLALQEIFLRHHLTMNDFSGQAASEDAIKQIESPSILHVATHGFFFSDLGKNSDGRARHYGFSSQTLTENPLLRSGLLMSGCQQFKTNTTDNASGEDGILTAYEAATLSLQNTSLVVLSACETGLGEVRNGEGVYGLQRSFFVAGARQIIMSLWKVDDEATQQFMTVFYSSLMESKDTHVAFRNAQFAIREKFPAPYYWGSFVLTGI